jgi:hypothetical protein
MINVAAQPMPYEAGRKALHRLEVTTAGLGMAGRPGEIRMRSGTEMVDVTEQSGHTRGVEVIEIRRPIVDHEVERRQRSRLHPGRVIGRNERSCILTTRLAMSQMLQERSGVAAFVLRMQIVDYASTTVP